MIPLEHLRFDFNQTESRDEAVEQETKWHRAYAFALLDHQPLDSSAGPKFDRKRKNEVRQALRDARYLR